MTGAPARAPAVSQPSVEGLFPAGVAADVGSWPGRPLQVRRSVGEAMAERTAEHAAGRAAAARALQAAGASDLYVGRSADGAPIWPEAFVGSISHGAGHVVAVAASRRLVAALGVDVERAGSLTPDLWEGVLCIDEVHAIESFVDASGLEAAQVATVAFSAKEAAIKCLSAVGVEAGFLDVVVRHYRETGSWIASCAGVKVRGRALTTPAAVFAGAWV